jgi:hypothetical protein
VTLAPYPAPSSPPQESFSLSLHLSSSLATVSSPGNGWELLWFLQVLFVCFSVLLFLFVNISGIFLDGIYGKQKAKKQPIEEENPKSD